MTYEDTFSSPVSATGCSENSDTFQIFASSIPHKSQDGRANNIQKVSINVQKLKTYLELNLDILVFVRI